MKAEMSHAGSEHEFLTYPLTWFYFKLETLFGGGCSRCRRGWFALLHESRGPPHRGDRGQRSRTGRAGRIGQWTAQLNRDARRCGGGVAAPGGGHRAADTLEVAGRSVRLTDKTSGRPGLGDHPPDIRGTNASPP